MRVPIYVISNDTFVRKAGNSIIIDRKGNKIPCPAEGISYIVMYGNSQISNQVLNFCAEKKILIFRFSYGNKYNGMFLPPESCIGKIRENQYKYYFDDEKRLTLAKSFVKTSAYNKLYVLKKHKNKGKDLKEEIGKIKEFIKNIDDVNSVESLRGVEGSIANIYFDGLKRCLKYYIFKTREYNPPKDEFNCLLSYCYALLYCEIASKLYEHGFDIFRGYLHEQNDDAKALVYDLSEVFKQKVDLFILELINKREIKKEFFNKKDDGSCFLDTYGKNFILKKWIALLRDTKFDEELDKPISWMEYIRKEVIKLKHHLEDDIIYKGFLL